MSSMSSPTSAAVTATAHMTERVGIVAITRNGAAQAAKLAQLLPSAGICTSAKFAASFAHLPNAVHTYQGALKDEIAPLWQQYDQIIFFVSLGAVVRLIAPHLQDKDQDPGVLVVDEAAQYVIPVLSGHVGGANAYSQHIAALLGATPIVTTASDVGQTIAVDILGRELGWQVHAPKINITRVSAAVVSATTASGQRIAVVQEAGSRHRWTRPTPLPAAIDLLENFTQACASRHAAVLWITHAPVPEAIWQQWHERLVVYRPPQGQSANAPNPLLGNQTSAAANTSSGNSNSSGNAPTALPRYALGLGCDRGTSLATMQQAIAQALLHMGASLPQVAAVATIDIKADETCLQELAALHGWRIQFYPARALAAVPVPNPSATVLRYTGTPSVSEAAALLAAGHAATDTGTPAPITALRLEKHKLRGADGRNATVSIAEIAL